jgi:Xaa-Pro aminopeptidase
VEARRARVAQAWALRDEVVLIGAGDRILIPGTGDQTYPFLSHPEYFYLTDRECPGAALAFDPQDGWTDFVPDVSERERIWEAARQVEGTSIGLLGAWLAARRGRPVVALGCELPGLRSDAERTASLREKLSYVRRPKDEVELGRIRAAAAATAAGYARMPEVIRPGVTERAIAIEIECAFRRAGGDRTAYDTIVGSGPNSAVLHFAPSDREVAAGDLVLIDAAAGAGRYVCDVTRTFPATGAFTPEQGDIYELVRSVERRAIERCRAGAELADIHTEALRETGHGLAALGLVRGTPDDLIERGVTELFFPHGISHMVGLGVRDARGSYPGRTPSEKPGRKLQRTDLPLEPGHVLTIEPGIYFIPALLQNQERRAKLGDAVVWARVDPWCAQGGIRIEDTVHVTSGAPEVITSGSMGHAAV